MKNIFVLGAGRSSTALIAYLMTEQASFNVIIGEKIPEIAEKKFPNAKIIPFDILDTETARAQLKTADLVISMLPATLQDCVRNLSPVKKVHKVHEIIHELHELVHGFTK